MEEEEDTMQPINDDRGSLDELPLIGGHLPLGDMGITPPLGDIVTEMCSSCLIGLIIGLCNKGIDTSKMILKVSSHF